MQTVSLGVSGMTCGGCVRSVRSVLESMDGVARADVSLDERRAVVEYDESKIDVDRLRLAIEDAGYEVAG